MVFCYWGETMKKMNIVTKNDEFNNIINIGKKFQSKYFYLYVLKNSLNINRYGIAVSKKIGNAVVRNKYKRQIKDIIDKSSIRNLGYDMVLISKLNIRMATYSYIGEDLIKLFNGLGG